MPTVSDGFIMVDALFNSFILGFASLFFVFCAVVLLVGVWIFSTTTTQADERHPLRLIGASVVGIPMSVLLFWMVDITKEPSAMTGAPLVQLGTYALVFGISMGLAGWVFRKRFKQTFKEEMRAGNAPNVLAVIGLAATFFGTLSGASAIIQGLFF